MKKLLYLLSIAFIVFTGEGCKKDGAPKPKEKLLSRILDDGAVRFEFEYSTGNQPLTTKRFTRLYCPRRRCIL